MIDYKKVFYDDYGNKAIIEKVNILPYKNSPRREIGYRLSMYSLYDNSFLYYVSVHLTMIQAIARLQEFSCNTWREM